MKYNDGWAGQQVSPYQTPQPSPSALSASLQQQAADTSPRAPSQTSVAAAAATDTRSPLTLGRASWEDARRHERGKEGAGKLEHDIKLMGALPVSRSAVHRDQRSALFDSFDVNGNGYLSLAEVDKGLHDTYALQQLYSSKPAVLRAFNAAKALYKGRGTGGIDDDYVSRAEFRMLLIYLHQYYELFKIFAIIDSGGDRRIDEGEFVAAVPRLAQWGLRIADARQTFREIDTNGGGQILFYEFCAWAMPRNLAQLASDGGEEEPAAPGPHTPGPSALPTLPGSANRFGYVSAHADKGWQPASDAAGGGQGGAPAVSGRCHIDRLEH